MRHANQENPNPEKHFFQNMHDFNVANWAHNFATNLSELSSIFKHDSLSLRTRTKLGSRLDLSDWASLLKMSKPTGDLKWTKIYGSVTYKEEDEKTCACVKVG